MACAGCLALGLVWGTPAAAGERDTYQPIVKKASGFWSWWPFGGSKKEPKPKPESAKPPAEARSAPRPPAAPPERPAPSAAEVEYQNFLRRQAVCDRLRQVANDLGDTRLEQQADLLEQQAWALYQLRVGAPPLPELPLKTVDDEAAARRLLSSGPARSADRPFHTVTAQRPAPRPEQED